jgi:hypothetical protein
MQPLEESKDSVTPLKALHNSVVEFGEVITAIKQQSHKQIDALGRKKIQLESELNQNGDNLIAGNDMDQ